MPGQRIWPLSVFGVLLGEEFRVGATQLLPDVLLEGVCPADGVIFMPGPLVEVALTFDVGVLEAVGPGADLA